MTQQELIQAFNSNTPVKYTGGILTEFQNKKLEILLVVPGNTIAKVYDPTLPDFRNIVWIKVEDLELF